tara:strand:- start:4184 stop:4627 length:444 start_codon:yes stop_codon:yes gene_type:complete
MIYLKHFVQLALVCVLPIFGMAQDCTLDIGGKNTNAIIELFQLNEAQISTMDSLRSALVVRQAGLEDQIHKLLNEQPQRTEAELIKLADKYKVLQQQMVEDAWECDKNFLSIFNPKQYQAYIALCNDANRNPIRIIPISYEEGVTPE